MAAPPIVVKIGGSTLGSHDTTLKDLVTLQNQGVDVVVVHGGGNVISQWMQRQGIPPQFVNGLRVTDGASLEIVVAVLTGLVNKELVAQMHELGGRAIGISGIDGGMLEARVANPELGYVGEIATVNSGPITALLSSGYMPMIAPLARQCQDDSDHSGGPLNINGDTVAGELAHALGAERLVFLTDSRIRSLSSGRSVRGSRISTSMPSALRISAASWATWTIRLQAMIVQSLPSRLMSASPKGIVYSSFGTLPLSVYIILSSKIATGLSSRMAVFIRPLASEAE